MGNLWEIYGKSISVGCQENRRLRRNLFHPFWYFSVTSDQRTPVMFIEEIHLWNPRPQKKGGSQTKMIGRRNHGDHGITADFASRHGTEFGSQDSQQETMGFYISFNRVACRRPSPWVPVAVGRGYEAVPTCLRWP